MTDSLSPKDITVRFASIHDIPTITRHRRLMFDDMGYTDPASLDAMDTGFVEWLRTRLERGEYIGWLLMDGETIVAGAGLLLIADPPRPFSLSGKKGYVLNVFTEPEYRRRGLARYVMQCIIEWCRAQAIPVVTLHASDKGYSLYESLGFSRTNEMRLSLE